MYAVYYAVNDDQRKVKESNHKFITSTAKHQNPKEKKCLHGILLFKMSSAKLSPKLFSEHSSCGL